MNKSTLDKIYPNNEEFKEAIIKAFIKENNVDIQCEKESCRDLKPEFTIDLIGEI